MSLNHCDEGDLLCCASPMSHAQPSPKDSILVRSKFSKARSIFGAKNFPCAWNAGDQHQLIAREDGWPLPSVMLPPPLHNLLPKTASSATVLQCDGGVKLSGRPGGQ